jgi:DNA-binding response OmpR family regulator
MATHAESVREIAKHAGRPRILLAEDDPELRRFVAFTLEHDGYDVVEAEDGTALLDRIASQKLEAGAIVGYDLLIADVQLPGYSALDILAVVRRALANTQVVLMTAFADADVRRRAGQLGVSTVFSKPLSLNEFRARVKMLLSHVAMVHA